MTEIIQGFGQKIDEYALAVEGFWTEHNLRDLWLREPDHVAIRCVGGASFDNVIKTLTPQSTELSYVNIDGRRLAAGRLIGPMFVGLLGQFNWIEIMGAETEETESYEVDVSHVGFCFPHFEGVRKLLGEKGIVFEDQSNSDHAWIGINANGCGVNIYDSTLEGIIQQKCARGEVEVIES